MTWDRFVAVVIVALLLAGANAVAQKILPTHTSSNIGHRFAYRYVVVAVLAAIVGLVWIVSLFFSRIEL
jgi:uncharacterized membrane protein